MADERRPHADKSEAELRAISLWIGQQIAHLDRQRAEIETELILRGGSQPPPLPVQPIAGGVSLLAYHSPDTRTATVGMIGDSYADEARSYSFRVGLITLLITGVMILILAALAVL